MTERVFSTAKTSESEQKCSNSCKKRSRFNSSGSTADKMLQLQKTAGNQAVQRLIKSGALQTKLKIGQPNDIYEQEADRVAEQVMRMPEPQAVSRGTLFIQRACPRCEEEKLRRQPVEEEEEKEKLLQTKEISGQNAEIAPDLESRINALRGGGQPLAESERAFFEPRFGHDFSHVRVHTDAQAAEAARAVNARAFTVGQDVVFGAGQYVYGTTAGKRLLAHELIHTVQQGNNVTKLNFKMFRNIIGRGRLAQIIQRVVGGDITQMSITEQFAGDLTDGELWGQIQIIRDQLTTLSPGSSEFDVARSNLQILEQEVNRRGNRPSHRAMSALYVAMNQFSRSVVENPPCTNRGLHVDNYTGVSGPLPLIRGNRVTRGLCGRAWCAYFVRWCLNQSGIPNGLTGAASSVRSWGRGRGWYHDINTITPITGDIFFKAPDDPSSSSSSTHPCDTNPCVNRGSGTGHVGFILSVSGNTIRTIEGNVHINANNDGLFLKTRNVGDLDGVLRIP